MTPEYERFHSVPKNTIDGYAEALLIAMRMCRDTKGLLLAISFGSPVDDAFIARQIAALMLSEPSHHEELST